MFLKYDNKLDVIIFFFFKQKTAYEMRISDWSSDVCSSDLRERRAPRVVGGNLQRNRTDDRRDNERRERTPRVVGGDLQRNRVNDRRDDEIGRASCRERECP